MPHFFRFSSAPGVMEGMPPATTGAVGISNTSTSKLPPVSGAAKLFVTGADPVPMRSDKKKRKKNQTKYCCSRIGLHSHSRPCFNPWHTTPLPPWDEDADNFWQQWIINCQNLICHVKYCINFHTQSSMLNYNLPLFARTSIYFFKYVH